MNIDNPIIFFGTEDFSAISLQRLIDDKFNIVGIVTKPDSKKGRGQKISMPKVKEMGIANNIEVLQPNRLKEIIPFVAKFNKPTGVLVSYGKIIPQSIIDLFSPGIINVHPSLLPLYRGPSPIESTILNGDTVTGVSIMLLSKEMDAGPVYLQEKITLSGTETSTYLYDSCGKIGSEMLAKALPKIIKGELEPINQCDNRASYCNLLTKEDSIINPDNITSYQAERKIRALEIYPKSKITICDNTIIIKKASITTNPNSKELSVKFKDNNYLVLEQLIAPNGKIMDGKAYKNGYINKMH